MSIAVIAPTAPVLIEKILLTIQITIIANK